MVNFKAACNSCRSLSDFSTVIMTADDVDVFDKSDLIDTIDESSQTCPNCGKQGNMQILTFQVGNLIYDLQNPSQFGRFVLRAEKTNNEIGKCELASDNNSFTPYDYLNAISIFEDELTSKRNNETDKIEKELFSQKDGTLFFSAKTQDDNPFIIPFGFSTYGFSYEEISKILTDLRSELRKSLKNNNMPI